MASYRRPQTRIFQDFGSSPISQTVTMNAVIIGESYFVFNYTDRSITDTIRLAPVMADDDPTTQVGWKVDAATMFKKDEVLNPQFFTNTGYEVSGLDLDNTEATNKPTGHDFWITGTGTVILDESTGVATPVTAGDIILMQFRAKNEVLDAGVPYAISSASEAVRMVGAPDPENPLGLGVYMALLNGGNRTVWATRVETGTGKDDITAALRALESSEAAYFITPVFKNDDTAENINNVYDQLKLHIDNVSTPERQLWRVGILGSVASATDTTSATAITAAVKAESSKRINRRLVNVFAGDAAHRPVLTNGDDTNNSIVAAAFAGLAGGALPQEPLTDVIINGFSELPGIFGFLGQDDLDLMAEGGTMIVAQDLRGGEIYVRHQITTAYPDGNLHTAEFSMVKNMDAISKFFKYRLRNYRRGKNVTPALLQKLEVLITDGLGYLMSNTEVEDVGPQLLGETTELLGIDQDPVYKDRVWARVHLQLPPPFNNFDLYLMVV